MILTRYRNSLVLGLVLVTSLLGSVSFAADTTKDQRLNLGDPAPALQPAKWLKGEPIPEFKKGQVYVVEFWATWCGPCKENIPHLTELAKKYKGKAEIIGVDIWEADDPKINTLPKVTAFVQSEGALMDYHVAADATDKRVANAWMTAAGEGGIPTTFVIGKDGRIAWIGHPMNLETVLPQVIAGQFDVAVARAARDKQGAPVAALQKAFSSRDYALALKLIDAVIAKDPINGEHEWNVYRFIALSHVDDVQFEKQARFFLTKSNGDIDPYNMFCAILCNEKNISPELYRFGLTLVDEALPKKERTFLFYEMGAIMNSRLGNKAEAVRMQTEAIKAADADTYVSEESKARLRRELEEYQASVKQ